MRFRIGKLLGVVRRADRKLAYHKLFLRQAHLQVLVTRGIVLIERRADHGDGFPSGLERTGVRCRIDAFRKTADNHYAILNQRAS